MIASMLLLCVSVTKTNIPKQISKLIQSLEEIGFCEKIKKESEELVIEKSVICPVNNKSIWKIRLTVSFNKFYKTNGNPHFYEFFIHLIDVDGKGSEMFFGCINYVSREMLTRTCSRISVILNSIVDVFYFITRFFGKPNYKKNPISFSGSSFSIIYRTKEHLAIFVEFRPSGTWIIIYPINTFERRSYRKLSDIIDLDIEYIKTHYAVLFKRKIRHAREVQGGSL
jgi:hypothetical protein